MYICGTYENSSENRARTRTHTHTHHLFLHKIYCHCDWRERKKTKMKISCFRLIWDLKKMEVSKSNIYIAIVPAICRMARWTDDVPLQQLSAVHLKEINVSICMWKVKEKQRKKRFETQFYAPQAKPQHLQRNAYIWCFYDFYFARVVLHIILPHTHTHREKNYREIDERNEHFCDARTDIYTQVFTPFACKYSWCAFSVR